ncbi:MAG: hypothetical protein HY736_04605 [Verrucomicrobia bacterium]|nr:hypothetical protein [Verrucomicrobiota bacterium]
MKPLIVRALCAPGFCAAMALTAARPEPSRMAARAPWLPDLGDGRYQNPVLFADQPLRRAERLPDSG